MEAWERKVLKGDFSRVPRNLSWNRSSVLAHFIDGYQIAGGQEPLIDLMHKTREHAAGSGAWSGSALDLWLCLFAEHRAQRWTGGYPLKRIERARLNGLCAALANRLRAASPEECATLVRLFSGMSAKLD
jgi:hypothetical protein